MKQKIILVVIRVLIMFILTRGKIYHIGYAVFHLISRVIGFEYVSMKLILYCIPAKFALGCEFCYRKTFCFLANLFVREYSIIWNNKEYAYYTTYFKGYYSKVAGTEEKTYESVIETNGLPEEIWEEEKTRDVLLRYLKYSDGRLFVFQVLRNGNYSYRRVEITNPVYAFGRKKIGVGTEIEAIEQTYKNSYESLTQDTLHEEVYYVEGFSKGTYAMKFFV